MLELSQLEGSLKGLRDDPCMFYGGELLLRHLYG